MRPGRRRVTCDGVALLSAVVAVPRPRSFEGSVLQPSEPASIDHPWAASYPPGVPPTYRLPKVTLPRLLQDATRDFPDQPALIDGRTELTYRQLRDQVAMLERALAHQGPGLGDRVAVMLPTGAPLVVVLLALWRRGAVAVPLDGDTPPDQVRALIGERDVVAMIASPDLVTSVQEAGAAPGWCLTVTGTEWAGRRGRTRPRRDRRLPRILSRRHRQPIGSTDRERPVTVVTLRNLLDEAAEVALQATEPGARTAIGAPTKGSVGPRVGMGPTADSPALLLVRSTPQGVSVVEHLHRTLMATAFQVRLWVPDVQAGRERVLIADPLHDLVGLAVGFLPALLAAGTAILSSPASGEDVTRAVDRHRPTILVARTDRLKGALDRTGRAKRDLTSLRVCLAIGDGLPRQVIDAWEQASAGARVRTMRGSDDVAAVTHGQPVYGRTRSHSIGLPLTATVAAVVDAHDLRSVVPPGGVGRLMVRGPQIPDVAGDGIDGGAIDGWLVTDDLVRVDEDGWFTLIDGKDEVDTDALVHLLRGIGPEPSPGGAPERQVER